MGPRPDGHARAAFGSGSHAHARGRARASSACAASAETAAKIRDDAAYAMRHHIGGTPLVVVNGRQAMPSAPLLYALVMADGNPSAPGFDVLPPPRPRPAGGHGHGHDDHAGHNH